MHDYIPNYGVVLIVFSLLIKILVYPLTKKSYQSTSAMQEIQPEVNKLREKFKNNPQKTKPSNNATIQNKRCEPFGWLLTNAFTNAFIICSFSKFSNNNRTKKRTLYMVDKRSFCPDVIINLPFSIPLYGDHIAFLPILMALSTYVQQKMMSGGIQQPQQKMMQNIMMVFSFNF